MVLWERGGGKWYANFREIDSNSSLQGQDLPLEGGKEISILGHSSD